MSDLISDLVSAVYKNKSSLPRFKIAATGGGALLQSIFALTPGISSSLVGNIYPYSEKETISYLGFRPEKLASEECALELAMKAYQDAVEYGQEALGIGISCALATERKLKGGERAFCAIFKETADGKSSCFILKFNFDCDEILNIQERRLEQETRIAKYIIDFLFGSYNSNIDSKKLSSLELQNQILKNPFHAANGKRLKLIPNEERNFILFPCTANPPHEAHFEMAKLICSESGKKYIPSKVLFNLTFDPPHKDIVEPHEMLLRTKMIQKAGFSVLISQGDGLFLDKIKKYKLDLMMGFDAFYNFLSQKFYSEKEIDFGAMEKNNGLDLKIFVFDRVLNEKISSLENIKNYVVDPDNWPKDLMPFSEQIKNLLIFNTWRIKFNSAISSTQIREKQLQKV